MQLAPLQTRKENMQVPLLDLKQQYATVKDELAATVMDVLDSQRYIGGPKVAELEQQIAQASGCRFGVGASSGTDAILNSLMSLDIGPGDEVITTVFTFFATVGCIARVGARPVFVDIDERTYNLDPTQLESAVTEHTKAIIPVHLYGQMADMDPIMAVAQKHDLAVIEDAAQSILSAYKSHPAGSIGTTGCFSFYPSKNLSGIGDGGMIVTNDESLYERLLIMRDHGQSPRYHYRHIGANFRLDSIQAAALLVKLPHLDRWSQARRDNATYYNQRFADTSIVTPFVRDDCVSVYNQYCIRVPRRDDLLAHLRANNIGCDVYYPVPMHMQACFADLDYRVGRFPVAEKVATEIMAIPVYPELTDEMKDYVAATILEFVA